MSLKDLIRGKKVPDKFATATVATFATQTPEERRTVASVATVTVAIPTEAKPAIQTSDDADDAAAVSPWWRFHYIEREPKEVMYSPPVNHAEALSGEPDAISAEPFVSLQRQPARPLKTSEEEFILQWLSDIGETDEEIIEGVLKRCQTDEDARNGYLRDAKNSNENRRWLR